MYHVYFYNFGYPSQESFATIEQAKEYGKKVGFQFYVCQYVNKQWSKVV